jgi:hypothetical protein
VSLWHNTYYHGILKNNPNLKYQTYFLFIVLKKYIVKLRKNSDKLHIETTHCIINKIP